MRQRYRVIDLMVALMVVGVAAALLLSAIQRSRQFSMSAECCSRLWNVSFALTQCERKFGRYPTSLHRAPGALVPTSFYMRILPEIDFDDLANEYHRDRGPMDPANWTVAHLGTRLMLCPASSAPPSMATPASYAANWGGGRGEWGADFAAKHGANRGVMGATWSVGQAEITDGASNTILLAEKPAPFPWVLGGFAASEFDVGPSPWYGGRDPVARQILAGSNHGTWTNVAYADGSVRSLRASIDRAVWYALITRDGGEAVKADD